MAAWRGPDGCALPMPARTLLHAPALVAQRLLQWSGVQAPLGQNQGPVWGGSQTWARSAAAPPSPPGRRGRRAPYEAPATEGRSGRALLGVSGPLAALADWDMSLPSGQMWASPGVPDASGVAVLPGTSNTAALMLCAYGQGCELGAVQLHPGNPKNEFEVGVLTGLTNPQYITPPLELNPRDHIVFAMI